MTVQDSGAVVSGTMGTWVLRAEDYTDEGRDCMEEEEYWCGLWGERYLKKTVRKAFDSKSVNKELWLPEMDPS